MSHFFFKHTFLRTIKIVIRVSVKSSCSQQSSRENIHIFESFEFYDPFKCRIYSLNIPSQNYLSFVFSVVLFPTFYLYQSLEFRNETRSTGR